MVCLRFHGSLEEAQARKYINRVFQSVSKLFITDGPLLFNIHFTNLLQVYLQI